MNEANAAGPVAAKLPGHTGFFEEIYDALLLLDGDGGIRGANARATALTGFEGAELLRLNASGLISGFRTGFFGGLSATLAPGKHAVMEGVLRRQDSTRVPVEIAVTRLERGPTFLFAIRKISGRPTSVGPESADTKAMMAKNILQGLSDAILVTNMKGEMCDENRRAREMFRYGESELRDIHISTLISGLDVASIQRIQRDSAENKYSVVDAFCMRKDGTPFPAEIAIAQVRVLEQNLMVFSVRNMERRRRVMDLLRTEHNALQNAASGIAITDMEGRIRFANRAFMRLWGYAMIKDIVGRDLRGFWAEKDGPEQMVAVAQGGGAWHGELSSSGLTGKVFHVQASAAANKDSRNRMSGLVFSFVDITDRKRAEMAIRKEAEAQMSQARSKDDFSGMLNIISVTDVLQLIDSTRKSGTLTVNGEQGVVGTVDFKNGQVIRSVCGEKTGEQAVYEILRREGTGFQFRQRADLEPDPSMQMSTMSLLLEGSRILDEERTAREEATGSMPPPTAL